MPTDEEKAAAEAEAEAALDTKIGAIVTRHLNGAITAHTKRISEAFTKTLDERFAKLTPAAPAAEGKGDAPAAGGSTTAPKADPETVKLREKLEQLEKKSAEAEAKAKAAEEKTRKDTARAAIREALEAKGIKGARARAVLADFEQSGALRFDEETGEAPLAIRRVRTKAPGAKAEELTFDLTAGIEDWLKTSDAAEFLPANLPPAQGTQRGTQSSPITRATTTTGPNDVLSDRELAEDLKKQGFDLSRV